MAVFCISLIACAASIAQAQNSGFLSAQQVKDQLNAELMTLLGHGDSASTARLQRFQSQIKPMFKALPKSADGGLDHGATRYALHRFFVQQHGWHVKGLEAVGAEKWGDSASTAMLEDHIPSYVLQLFEQRKTRTGLQELAVLAATFEDLVHSEAIQLLSTAYAAQNMSVDDKLDDNEENRLVATYLLFHIMPNPRYASLTTDALNRILQKAPKFYTGWDDTVLWVQDLQGAMDHEGSSRQNPFVSRVVHSRDFNSITQLVEGMGKNYGQFQNLECHQLKNALLDLSDGTGRVRLSKFYESAYENTSQHFSESPEYLRHLGVLDESDPEQPSVIVTNYMYSRANCLAASSLYSICCIDACEALMAGLERSIASPLADPKVVAELVAAMSSETSVAPRNLSAPMHRRLHDIAVRHEGSIPLHGRLFAQWMHHAFPNECPYPHASGSLVSPLTPSEWMHADGEVRRAIKATKEQMQSIIEAAVKVNSSEAVDAQVALEALPWTDEEELVVAAPAAHPLGSAKLWLRFAAILLAVCSAAAGLFRMLGAAPQACGLLQYSARASKHAWWQTTSGDTCGHNSHFV